MEEPKLRDREIKAAFVRKVRSGPWTPARRVNVIGLFGEITVDLTAARLEPGLTILDLAASCSIVRIVVPDDVAVDMDLRVLLGSVRRDPEVLDAASSPDRPCVRVTGHTLLSRLDITRGTQSQ
jgi:predicted membrane protein